jgi:hypothetical protein
MLCPWGGPWINKDTKAFVNRWVLRDSLSAVSWGGEPNVVFSSFGKIKKAFYAT